MLEADVLGVEEGCEPLVVGGADIEGDVAVECLDGDGMKLFIDEADVFEVGGGERPGGC